MLAITKESLILLRIAQGQTAHRLRQLATAKAKPRELNRERRQHMVDTTAALLRTGQPTHFAFEGPCRYGMRASLCLQGWSWSDADTAAADVVAAALAQIGAVRPTYQQAQPEWTEEGFSPIERTRCRNCAGKLSGREDRKSALYCSDVCMASYHVIMSRRFGYAQSRAEYLAAHAANRARKADAERDCDRCGKMFRQGKNKARTYCDDCASVVRAEANRKHDDRACLQCGTTFTPKRADAKFCSRACMSKAFSADRRAPRSCAHCGTTFAPKKGSDQKYCSHACYAAGKANKTHAARDCIVCAKSFTPAWPHAKYCSKLCQARFEREKKAAALPPKQCENCGTFFRSEREVARFCGTSCAAIARNRAIREASAFRCEAVE